MKKKLLLSVLALFVFAAFTFSVNATTVLNVETSQPAKAPSKAYGSDTMLSSVVGNEFDLSKLKFGEVTGSNKFEKIYLGTIPSSKQQFLLETKLVDPTTGKPNFTLDNVFGSTWFSAYCLDGTKKYPGLGIYSSTSFYTNLVAFETARAQGDYATMRARAKNLVNYVIHAAISNSNDSNIKNLLSTYGSPDFNPEGISFLGYTGGNTSQEVQVDLLFLGSILDNLQTMEGGTTGFTIYITSMNFVNDNDITQVHTATAAELSGGTAGTTNSYSFYPDRSCDTGYTFNKVSGKCINDSNSSDRVDPTESCQVGTLDSTTHRCVVSLGSDVSVYPLTFNSMDVLFNKFKLSGNLDGYEHALWILEHTYPTLEIGDALAAAGTSLDAVKQEVKTLYNIADEQVEEYTENVVYGVVQYALWKSTLGVDPGNATIGNTVTDASGTVLTELNKLYDYLIREREEYTGYGSTTYTNEISLSKPAAGKEIFKESKTAYTYGPYKATYSVLEANGMNISAKNDSSELSKIKFIDESGNTITKLTNGQTFYVVVEKSAKIGSVKLHLELVDAVGFDPATNRGKVYSPIFVNAQNVMVGGKIKSITVEKDFDLVYNPKTGVENIAVLLMVTLVAFSLGYLVLSYRAKPVGLN